MERIFGKGKEGGKLSDEERSGVIQYLTNVRERGMEQISGEFGKSPEGLEMIEQANSMIGEEMKRLGAEQEEVVGPDKIHLLRHEDFRKLDPATAAKAYSNPYSNHVYMDVEEGFAYTRSPRIAILGTFTHELIHSYSHKKYHVDRTKQRLGNYRTGYVARNFAKDENPEFFFFNEAVTEAMTRELLLKNKDRLDETFGFSDEEWNAWSSPFETERQILDRIVEGVASHKGEEPSVAWNRMKRGAFTGNMMHLRDVERAFGKGTLRVVAFMGGGIKTGGLRETLQQRDYNLKVLDYLNAKDEEEREKLSEELSSYIPKDMTNLERE